MTVSIHPVGEELWSEYCDILEGRARGPQPHPDYPFRYYVGRIKRAQYDEIVAWIEAHVDGPVIHNFNATLSVRRLDWFTIFALQDARSAFLFKLRWEKPWTNGDMR